MTTSAPIAMSKRAKVWKRTVVGAGLAASLALVLWGASFFASVWPVVAAAGAMLAVCIFEVDRMGTLAGRRIALALALPALAGLVLAAFYDSMFIADAHEPPGTLTGFESGLIVAIVLGVTTLSFALVRGTLSMRIGAALCIAVAVVMGRSKEPDESFSPFTLALVAFFFVVVLAVRSARLRIDFAIVTALALWLIVPFSGLAVIWNHFDHVGLVALVVLCKIGDTAAYYVGNAIGKHHPFKTISPGKTIEGCAASFVAGCACGAVLVAAGVLPRAPHGWIAGCAAGAIVNLAAQAGDLLESWVKRRAGVKDSSTWFGPSGGMLDLVDSVLLGLPAALATWPLLFNWQ